MPDSTRRSIVEIYRDQTGARQQIHVAADRTKTLRIMRGRPVTVVELSVASGFRGDGVVLTPGDPHAERSPFPALAAALLHAREHPAERLLVAAHGADEERSARQARNVLLFLRADRAAWAADAGAGARVDDWQQVLAWAAAARGWPCDPGAIDGLVGPRTRKALGEFRARWSAEAGAPAPTGEVGPADWEAFFDLMDGVLAHVVQEPRAELSERRAAMGIVERAAVGCGAAWPPERVRIADHTAAEAERVDLLFFAEADLPRLDCHGEGASDWKRCDVYRKQKYCARHPEPPSTGTVRVRLTGMLFETDRTFLLPRSLKAIKAFKRLYDKRKPGEVLVVGHTDTMGAKAHNLKLSVNRARSIEAYLRDQVDAWLDWYGADKGGQRWGVREDKHMLSHLKDASGAPFYAGPIDASATKAYHDALRAFQTWSNQARGTSLKVDGLAEGKGETRQAMVGTYMAEDDTTLPAESSVSVHGCGEFHPARATADEVAEEENRRVEVFLFPTAATPPPRDCVDPGCTEYALWLGQTQETIDLRDDLATLEVSVVDQHGEPVPHADVAIDGPGADQGSTGPDGRLVLEDQLPGTYRVTVSKQGHEPVTVDAEAPGLVEVLLFRVAPAIARSIPGTVFVGRTSCPTPGAFAHIGWLHREADLGGDRRVRVFAHVSDGGDLGADKALSDRRARMVVALLTRDLATFEALAVEEDWPLRCYQAMLRGLSCDPGPLDGKPGPATRAAVRGFQRDYSANAFHEDADVPRAYGELPVTGDLDAGTKAAVRDAYLAHACAGASPLPVSAFVETGASGCASFNPRPDLGAGGADRVEVAVFTEPPPEAFPCRVSDAAACALEGGGPPRCRFYREVLVHDETVAHEAFFDLAWRLDRDGRTVHLTALTPLPDGTPVTFTVHRRTEPAPSRPPSSSTHADRPTVGPVLGVASGVIESGIAAARWTPPSGYDPFDWSEWLVDTEAQPGAPVQPPVFVVEAGARWAWSRPPGVRLDRLRFREGARGMAILADGRVVPFATTTGRLTGDDEVVAVHLEDHVVEGVAAP